MAQLPAHASPAFSPSTAPQPSRTISDYHLQSQTSTPAPSDTASDSAHDPIPSDHREALRDAFSSSGRAVPSFISPAITPPATPGGTSLPTTETSPARQATGTQTPDLVEQLPEVECIVRARIPTTSAHELFLHVYHNNVDNKEHLAIVFGNHIRSRSLDAPRPGETEMDRMIRGAYEGRLFPGRTTSRVDQLRREAGVPTTAASSGQQEEQLTYSPLVRIHSECYTGETVWSARCDCGEQLDEAARQMSAPESGGGVIIYLRQEGRGIGLGEKLKAYNLQDLGNDTYEANLLLRHPADARSYGLATAMLVDLGLGGADGIRLLTNNPDKVRAVEGPRREVVVRERVPMVPLTWKSNGEEGVHGPELEKYLSTKIEKFKHLLS